MSFAEAFNQLFQHLSERWIAFASREIKDENSDATEFCKLLKLTASANLDVR
jgi:hypothetical protein